MAKTNGIEKLRNVMEHWHTGSLVDWCRGIAYQIEREHQDALNERAETICELNREIAQLRAFEAVLERHMAAKWNTRWERMCHMNYVSLYDEEGVDGIECDECGWSELYDPGYPHPAHCPGCGAKVVGE